MKGLQGKLALITGGATSIGAAITRNFHGAGTSVVIADLNQDAGRALAAELGPRARHVVDRRALDQLSHRLIRMPFQPAARARVIAPAIH